MAELIVDAAKQTLGAFGRSMPCVIGHNGSCAAEDKREGDGRTPLGSWPIRGVLLRRDRVALPRPPGVAWRWLRRSDGWSDDTADPDYNRPVTRRHAFGAESLWRDDATYDVVVVLGHNDASPRPGLGSAIFLHVAPESGVTAGCVALARDDLLDLIGKLAIGDTLDIRAG